MSRFLKAKKRFYVTFAFVNTIW